MKMILFVGVAILTAQFSSQAFAAEKKIFVSVERCESVVEEQGNTTYNLRWLAGGSESMENAEGKLTISARDYEAAGEKRTNLDVKFVAKDGKIVELSLSNTAGSHAIVRAQNCASQEDAGRIGIMASFNDTGK